MDDQVTIHAPATGGLTTFRDSGFGALDSEARAQSYRNLAAAAYVYAGVYFVAFWSGWLISSHSRGEAFSWPESHFTMFAVPSILMALVIAWAVQRHHIPAASFALIAQVFLVLSCLGIAGNAWGWQNTRNDANFSGVHWVGVWTVMFSATVTLPPGQMLRAGFLASLMIPLSRRPTATTR
jgi:hypothetical protein